MTLMDRVATAGWPGSGYIITLEGVIPFPKKMKHLKVNYEEESLTQGYSSPW